MMWHPYDSTAPKLLFALLKDVRLPLGRHVCQVFTTHDGKRFVVEFTNPEGIPFRYIELPE